jgi:DNA-binding NtrC family response regulator
MSDNAIASLAGFPVEDPLQQRRTVLVVEDEVFTRIMVADELRSRGFNLIEAQNADEAVTLLQSQVPVGLVLTDVQLPGPVDGLALARLFREARPEVKVVIASGNIPLGASPDIAHAFFRKPYPLDSILKCIENLLGDSST